MKLKLENHQGITILNIAERISATDSPILKAGVSKLLEAGKKNLLLDLSSAKDTPPEILQEINTLTQLAKNAGANLLIVCDSPRYSHASSREVALHKMKSSLAVLESLETELKSKLESLERQKADLNRALPTTTGSEKEMRDLKRKNTALKRDIKQMEAQLQNLLKIRPPAFPVKPDPDSSEKSHHEVISILTAVLEQEGIIPVI